jgi:circadian clock protein KaiB
MEEQCGRDPLSAASANNCIERFEPASPPCEPAVLRLYVAGGRPGSLRAITMLKALCEQYLTGRYDLEIIDIYQQPELAAEADIVAAPTLVKQFPSPPKRFVGDLSDPEKLLSSMVIPSELHGHATP